MRTPLSSGAFRTSVFASILLLCGTVQGAGLLVADGGLGGVLEIKDQKIKVTINNGIAVTKIDQTFVNTENRIVEALYTFPVPEGGSVSNFSMWIDGKEMIGEVVEKQRAREIYESYKTTRRDPGLLEQVDYKTFEMRIFPIAAGAEQRVQISYYQQLDVDHDRSVYVYPLATTTRRDIDQQTTGEFSFSLRVLSPVPIVSIDSPSHGDNFVFAKHSDQFYEASLETAQADLSRDIVVAMASSRPQTGVDLITSTPPGEDGYFMATFTAGQELEDNVEPMDYVFVLDVSGSMADSGKLGLSRASIEAFIKTLAPEDRFEVICFNLQPDVLFGQLEAAVTEKLDAANAFLLSKRARGGTVLGPAMRTAYKYGDPDRRLNVVILSDGMTEQDEQAALIQSIRQRPANATVFAIGVGNEVNRPLLSQLAEEAGGLADFLSAGDDFQRQSKSFRRKLTRPAATNDKLAFENVGAYDIVPKQIPNLYHGKPVHIFGRFRKGQEFAVNYSAEVMGQPVNRTESIPVSKEDNPEIERMWAWNRVQEMQREQTRLGGEQFVPAIVDLGEKYSIATRYTSFLVLENNDEYRRWKIRQRNSDRLDRDRDHQDELDEELERLRDESLVNLGPLADRPDLAALDTSPKFNSPSPSSSAPAVTTPEPSGGVLAFVYLAAWVLFRRRLGHANGTGTCA
jgi:Ca-activated chloride channel family protein